MRSIYIKIWGNVLLFEKACHEINEDEMWGDWLVVKMFVVQTLVSL